MDPNIIGAIVVAAGSVVGAIIAIIGKRKAEEERKDAEKAIINSGTEEGGVSEEAPYELDGIESNIRLDESGEAECIKKYINLRPRQSFHNLEVPYIFICSRPEAYIKDVSARELPGAPIPVTIKEIRRNHSSAKGNIVIPGLLEPDAGTTSFELQVSYRNGYCMTREDAVKAYRNDQFQSEYDSVFVAIPIQRLRLVISFPQSHEGITPAAVVFIGRTETIHGEETKRVKEGLTFVNRVATLTVEKPVVNLNYAIYWMPPQI